MLDLIAKKRDGRAHSAEELDFIARAAAAGSVPDYQLSAWLMAVVCRGMNEQETVAFTRAMAASGDLLDLAGVRGVKADKHSTGGVGDGVSLVLAPLCAAAGLVVPMMSGRGLGHTGGTLDKLEAIPGFRVSLSAGEIKRQLCAIGVAMFGQNERLAPADRALYQLRDATATVPALALIVGSILSKKAAEGLDALVFDVKAGSGAIFQDVKSAERLARALVKTGNGLGIKCVGLLTAMDQPLGRAVGNALELKQAIEVLQGDFKAEDFVECTLVLGGWMLKLGGLAKTAEDGAVKLEALLKNGQALDRFKRMVAAQGGDPKVAQDPGFLPKAAAMREFKAAKSGYLWRLDARRIGELSVLLGAGRSTKEDALDYGAGFVLEKKLGDKVDKGEVLARLYGSDGARLEEALKGFPSAIEISPRRPKVKPVVLKTIQMRRQHGQAHRL